MASYFVTGSTRGIGLAITTLLASKPESEVSIIFAAARTQREGLKQLAANSAGRVEIVPIDATSEESVSKAAEQVEWSLGSKGLDVLINCVGIMPQTPGGIETMTDLEMTFKTNVLSSHLVTRAFIPLLKKGHQKKVINISSTLGSITLASKFQLFPVPAYKVSKAALNMLTVQYALALEDEGFTVFTISPGWVQTDLGGAGADLTPNQGCELSYG
ncbi:hypothetical protein MAP00_001470 [Monascus purpureus]|nr:hypothetical protein MAP00_001470 [Monascus purpureus]